MAYEIKGDANVKRKLTALGGRQGNFFSVISEVDFTTAEPAHVAGELYMSTGSGFGSTSTTVTFTANRLYRSTGSVWFEIAPTEGFMMFNETSDIVKTYNGTSWLVVGGGLVQQGAVTSDADAGQGIYTLDASGAAFDFTLPAATGSQVRYLMLGGDVATNNATIKVQGGEALNNSTDGSYTMSTNGQAVLFLDYGTGLWSAQVIGGSTETTLAYGALRVASTLSDLQNLTGSTSGTDYATARPFEFNEATQTLDDPDGIFDLTNNRIEIKKAGRYRIQAVFSVHDLGGTTTSAYMIMGDTNTTEYDRNFVTTGDGHFDQHILSYAGSFVVGDFIDIRGGHNSGESQMLRSCEIFVQEIPTSEVVLAGMIEPTALHRISVDNSTYGQVVPTTTFTKIEIDGAVSPGNVGLTANAGHEIVVAQDGNYKIQWRTQIQNGGTSQTINAFCRVNGVNAHGESQVIGVSADFFIDGVFSVDLVAGDLITFETESNFGHNVINGFAISVDQNPSSTIVNPDTLTPTTLDRARLALTADTLMTGGPAPVQNTIAFDQTVYNVGALSIAGGAITISTTGYYQITAHWPQAAAGVVANDTAVIVQVDGANAVIGGENQASGGGRRRNEVTSTLFLNAGQVLTVDAYCGDQIPTIGGSASEDGARAWVEIAQQPASTVIQIDPAALDVETLHYVNVAHNPGFATESLVATTIGAGYSVIDLDAANIGVVYDPQGMLTTADNSFTIQQDGLYELKCSSGHNGTGDHIIAVNGVAIAHGEGAGTTSVDKAISSGIAELSAGDKVEFGFGSTIGSTFSLGFITINQLPTRTVVDPGSLTVDDQTTSGYFDFGNMRMAWGTTAGTTNIESIVFPGGGFASAPSVTMSGVDSAVRESAINNITATGVDLRVGTTATVPKSWQATGPKP